MRYTGKTRDERIIDDAVSNMSKTIRKAMVDNDIKSISELAKIIGVCPNSARNKLAKGSFTQRELITIAVKLKIEGLVATA